MEGGGAGISSLIMSGVTLTAPERRTAADEAEHALFQAIASGDIPPGAQLRLQELSDQLQMSMMPIREAIRRLQGLGLVEVVAHKGAWVRPLTVEDLYDTYFTRIHLETRAFIEASGKLTDEVVARAQLAVRGKKNADAAGDLLTSRAANERFHFELYQAAGSAWLLHCIWPVWRNSERYRTKSMQDARHVAKRAREHTKMLDALVAGDTREAVVLLISHLATSAELVASALEPSTAPVRALPTVDDILIGAATRPARRRARSA
jgi:DNA-binding GntR family transcriptional regulator